MITVKDNICHGRQSTEITFKVDVANEFFKSSYDDSLIRNAIEHQLITRFARDLEEMYLEYTRKKFEKKED